MNLFVRWYSIGGGAVLLALLLINLNRCIPAAGIADALWGREPPASADVPESATILHQRRGEKWDDGIVVKVNTRRFSRLQLFVLPSVPASPVQQRYTCYSASQSPF